MHFKWILEQLNKYRAGKSLEKYEMCWQLMLEGMKDRDEALNPVRPLNWMQLSFY